MDRRQYQRDYMRRWRARQPPPDRVVERVKRRLGEFADYAHGQGWYALTEMFDDAASDLDVFLWELANNRQKSPEMSDEPAKTP